MLRFGSRVDVITSPGDEARQHARSRCYATSSSKGVVAAAAADRWMRYQNRHLGGRSIPGGFRRRVYLRPPLLLQVGKNSILVVSDHLWNARMEITLQKRAR